MGRIRVAILCGGWSGEREVSIKSGEAVGRALDRKKYEVTMVDPATDLDWLVTRREEVDVAFVLLHGRFGEDGRIQGLLDLLGIRYVGSGVLASALALNKRAAKRIFKGAGLRVPKDVVVGQGERHSARAILEEMGPEVVVKPVEEGSSLGISICDSERDLEAGIEAALALGSEALVEERVKGREVTCCVVGKRELEALPLIEILPKREHRFFDYEAKYGSGETEEVCPAVLDREEREACRRCAETAHRALGCRVWSRTDMILKGGAVFVLETNTIPGMTEASLFPLAARAAGVSLAELSDRLIILSLEEKR